MPVCTLHAKQKDDVCSWYGRGPVNDLTCFVVCMRHLLVSLCLQCGTRLPVVSAKFVDPAPMDKAAFDAAWQACLFTGNAVDMPIPSTDKWMKVRVAR